MNSPNAIFKQLRNFQKTILLENDCTGNLVILCWCCIIISITQPFTRIFYLFYITEGYRIYQSADDAFSLKAWLTTDRSLFYKDSFLRGRHLIVWEKNRKRIEKILKSFGYNFRDLSRVPSIIRPWMKYVRVSHDHRSAHALFLLHFVFFLLGKFRIQMELL